MAEKRILAEDIADQTARALWEVNNVIECVPDALWDREYCDMPLWRHIYHMLHSLDRWFINPYSDDYAEPAFHTPNLNSLDLPAETHLDRDTLREYLRTVSEKTLRYTGSLTDEMLYEKPEGSPFTRLRLILGQFRHLHSHMGMLMGFIIEATGDWPLVLGLSHPYPEAQPPLYDE